MKKIGRCPYCCEPVLDRDVDTLLTEKRANVSDSCRVRALHGHRLYLVTTGSCVRLMWGTDRADIEATIRARRNGQGTLPVQSRTVTYADLRRLTEARSAVPG